MIGFAHNGTRLSREEVVDDDDDDDDDDDGDNDDDDDENEDEEEDYKGLRLQVAMET